MSYSKSMLPDYPIRFKTEDLLRRVPLAEKVASLILDFQGEESFVIGIDGAWGSGKTSFVNLVLEQLVGIENRVSIIEFNPWNFSGQSELIEDFFNSLLSAIKENEPGRQRIKEYAAKLIKKSELTFEPEVSVWGVKVSVGKLRKFGGKKTLQESRKAVDALLRGTGKRIVIVVDDTDRLDIQETKLIFKLLKMTANFPNTVFILAYDREKVAEKVTEQGLPGEEYLKKIVQVNFRLPQPDQQDLNRILFRDIDKSIEHMDERTWNVNRWSSLFQGGLKDFFKTIRDVKRYVSSLSLDLSIVGKNEVNLVDFLGIEAIRVFAPEVYTTIGNNKDLFTETQSTYVGIRIEDNRKARIKEIDDIVESYDDVTLRESLKGIIRELFPQVDGLYRNTNYGPDWQGEWRKNLQVASPDIFGRYFQLSTPIGTVSEEGMKVLMSTLTEVKSFIDNLKKVDEEGKLRNALTRVMDYLTELSDNQKQNLITALMNFGDTVKVEKVGIFDLEDYDTLIARLIYNTLKSLGQDKRVNFLKNSIEETKNTYTGTYIVGYLSHEHKEYEEKKSIQEPLLSKNDLGILETLCVEQIKAAEKQEFLLTTKNLPYILFRWKEWGSEDDIRTFIRNNIESKKRLVILLTAFVSRVLSTTGNYNTLSKTSIGKLYDIQLIEKKVANISSEDLNDMNEAEKEAVSLFRNPPKNHFHELS
jgi:predicted KAP-like P-loop ATPase